MNVDEAATLLAEATTLNVVEAATDDAHFAAMAAGWAEVCQAVPFDFAHRLVITWDSVYRMRASQLRGAWEVHTEKVTRAAGYSETACAWARLCYCAHTDCINGHLAGPPAEHEFEVQGARGEMRTRMTLAVRWCPECWNGRNRLRAERGKEPRSLGDVSP